MDVFLIVSFWFIIIVIAVSIYFIPSIIAFKRGHKNRFAIFLLNFLLGLTSIGWVIALVWAVTNSQDSVVIIHNDSDSKSK